MQRKQFLGLFLMGALASQGVPFAAAQETTYWLGSRDGFELRFNTRLPADAVAIILHKNNAPNKGDDTKPRYKNVTRTVNGKSVVVHTTELSWETPKLDGGGLTWVVDAGVGADWRYCDTKNPLWAGFAAGLKGLASEHEGWSYAKVVVVESKGPGAPSVRLNLDGTAGKPTKAQLALWKLTDLNGNASLSEAELARVREYFLEIANAGRANPNYRRQNGSKKALDLPSGLTALVLNDIYNKAAQNQAEYCAKVKEATHDQDDPKYAMLGDRLKLFGSEKPGAEAAAGGVLQDYPEGWMKSETHYKPWWNLEGETSSAVGFGVAKGDDGSWYMVAVLGEIP